MSTTDGRHYSLDPDDEDALRVGGQAPSHVPAPTPPPPPQSEVIPVGRPIEQREPSKADASAEPAREIGIESLDVCPNCGRKLAGANVIVCMECGYDMKSNRVIQTRVAKPAAVAPLEEEPTRLEAAGPARVGLGAIFARPSAAGDRTGSATGGENGNAAAPNEIVRPGMGGTLLPGVMAAVGGGVLVVGFLAGFKALFPTFTQTIGEGGVAVGVGGMDRLLGILRSVVLVGVWTAAGIGALWGLSLLLVARLGDLKLAALRVLAIVVTMRLATFIDVPATWKGAPTWEWLFEAVAAAGITFGLTMLLFTLKPRDAATAMLMAVMGFVVVWLGSYVVAWGASPS